MFLALFVKKKNTHLKQKKDHCIFLIFDSKIDQFFYNKTFLAKKVC